MAVRVIDVKVGVFDENNRIADEVRKSNMPARCLYEKHGFRSEGVRPKYYDDNKEDAVIMWRRR